MYKLLEGLLKGLLLWLYGLILDGVEYMASALMEAFSMDLAYFESYAPVTSDIVNIIIATGWALLMGNLVFQATRAMVSGIGFEGEDLKILFTRTFAFSFLLLASRQICNAGLTLTNTVMDLVGIPGTIAISTPEESQLGYFDSAWLLVIILGLILIFQVIKFFFEIAERYVVLAILTIMAPLAFGMGGSKNTEDIFKDRVRMYGSMCMMMLMNVVFLKLLLSAMATIPSGAGILPWLLFVVAIARVARKVDDLVCRVGLNPARTGDPLGRGLPLMLTMTVARNLGKTVANTFASSKTGSNPGQTGAAGSAPRPGPAPSGGPGGPGGSGGPGGQASSSRQSERATSSMDHQKDKETASGASQIAPGRPPIGRKGAGLSEPSSESAQPSAFRRESSPPGASRPDGRTTPSKGGGVTPASPTAGSQRPGAAPGGAVSEGCSGMPPPAVLPFSREGNNLREALRPRPEKRAHPPPARTPFLRRRCNLPTAHRPFPAAVPGRPAPAGTPPRREWRRHPPQQRLFPAAPPRRGRRRPPPPQRRLPTAALRSPAPIRAPAPRQGKILRAGRRSIAGEGAVDEL